MQEIAASNKLNYRVKIQQEISAMPEEERRYGIAPLADEHISIQDCKTPACIAHQLSNTIMLAKAKTGFSKLFILGFLAGIYVGFGVKLQLWLEQTQTVC